MNLQRLALIAFIFISVIFRVDGHSLYAVQANTDSIFMRDNVARLREVVVEGKRKKMLHILAYVREYSTLSSYTDTVTMFREKMVDFMLPIGGNSKNKGWRDPRVLNSRSYYRFTNNSGLDSVSDRCNYHFSWSDWIGLFPTMKIPSCLQDADSGIHTVEGKFGATEIWTKQDDAIIVKINVMADTASLKWVPDASYFFRDENIDFEEFGLTLNYSNVGGKELSPLELTGYSFDINSRGRGHGMFKFNHRSQPFFVTTHSEGYIIDKEVIPLKEAKAWEKWKFNKDNTEMIVATDAPELQPQTLALINRVNYIDADSVRQYITPDSRIASSRKHNQNLSIGYRMLSLFKQMTGISEYRMRKNNKSKWDKFKERQREKNDKTHSAP